MIGKKHGESRTKTPKSSNSKDGKNPESNNDVIFVGDARESSRSGKRLAPTTIVLKNLGQKMIRDISGNAININVITNDNKYLYSDQSIADSQSKEHRFKTDNIIADSYIVSADSGLNHTVVIKALNIEPGSFSTVVLAKGSNDCGQLGISGAVKADFTGIKVPPQKRFVKVVCGPYTTFLLADTCEVFAFGMNKSHQLGLGIDQENVTSPTLVTSLLGIHIVSMAAGLKHTIVLSSTGLMFGCGSNEKNELASNHLQYDKFCLMESFKDLKMVKIASSMSVSAAMDESGSVYIWGDEYGFPPKDQKNERDPYIDFALGNDMRLCLLTKSGTAYVTGFYSNGESVKSLVEISEYSVYSVFSLGYGFMLCSGVGVSYWCQKEAHPYVPSLLPLTLPYLNKKELMHPTNTLFLHCNLFPSYVLNPKLDFITRQVFSSLACLNGSFLNDHFYEGRDNDCGLNFEVIESFYDAFNLSSKRDILTHLEQELTNTIRKDVLDVKTIDRKPYQLRFILIALMHPSPEIYNSLTPFELWKAVLLAISKLNAYDLITEWLLKVDIKHFKIMASSLSACLSELARRSSSYYSSDAQLAVFAIEMFYRAAIRDGKLEYSFFYQDGLSSQYDFSIEYNSFMNQSEPSRQTTFSYSIRAPWLLSAVAKTSLVQRFFASKMADFINLVAQSNNDQNATHFVLTINRNDVLGSTVQNLISYGYIPDEHGNIQNTKNRYVFHKKLKVVFQGEQGVDAGGVQREYFELIIKELFKNGKLFINKGMFFWFNKNAKSKIDIQKFLLTGVIVGLAVFNGNILDICFPNVIYKKIKNIAFNLQDIEEYDEQVYNSLKDLLYYNGDVEKDLCLTWEYENEEVVPGGRNKAVTNQNCEDYVDAVVKFILSSSISSQFEAFKRGFLTVLPPNVLRLFRPDELSLLVTGQPELNFYELEENTAYEGYNVKSPTIRNFWHVIHDKFNSDDKKRFLYFSTSFKRAPLYGMKSLNFTIIKDTNVDHLPTAHTCSCVLVLPEYKTIQELEKKLRYAISHSEGFQFK